MQYATEKQIYKLAVTLGYAVQDIRASKLSLNEASRLISYAIFIKQTGGLYAHTHRHRVISYLKKREANQNAEFTMQFQIFE